MSRFGELKSKSTPQTAKTLTFAEIRRLKKSGENNNANAPLINRGAALPKTSPTIFDAQLGKEMKLTKQTESEAAAAPPEKTTLFKTLTTNPAPAAQQAAAEVKAAAEKKSRFTKSFGAEFHNTEAKAAPTYKTSAEISDKKAQVDSELKALDTEYWTLANEQAQAVDSGNAGASGTANYEKRYAEIKAQKAKLKAESDNLANQYYELENKEKQKTIATDTKSAEQYTSAQDIQSDIDIIAQVASAAADSTVTVPNINEQKDYLKSKYGISDEAIKNYAIGGKGFGYTDSGYGNLWQLYEELSAQLEQDKATLEQGGYNYERMTGYEQTLADKQAAQQKAKEDREYAKKHPVLASVDSILTAPFQGVDVLKNSFSRIGKNDSGDLENYVPMNSYNMAATNYVQNVRNQVSEDIEKKTDWKIAGQNVASFLYQSGMSIADSTLLISTIGSASVYFMAANSAAMEQKRILDNGGTNSQALWSGLAAGAAEAIFERISVGNLLKAKNITGIKSLLKSTAEQAGVEFTEEAFTEVSNILTNAVIMGDSSDFNIAVDKYKAQGMTEEKAQEKALLEIIGRVTLAGVGGAISGGVMGGGVAGLNYAGNDNNGAQTQQNEAETYFKADTSNPYTNFNKEGNLVLPTGEQLNKFATRQKQSEYAERVAASLRSYNVKNVVIEDMPEGVTGRWEKGVVYVSSKLNTMQAINVKIAHEISHAAQQSDTAFTNDILNVMSESGTNIAAAIAKKKEIYSEFFKSQNMSDAEIAAKVTDAYVADEVTADFIGELMKKDDLIKSLSTKPTLIQRIIDAISRLLSRSKSTTEKASYLELAQKLREAAGVTTETGAEGVMTEERYALEERSIKQQIRESSEVLNNMEPVAKINSDGFKGLTKQQQLKEILNILQSSGFEVDRQNFGKIVFDENRLNNSLNYAQTDAERAAFAALPQVLKRGTEISQKTQHKGRAYGTVTIAAPIVINNQRGNMAAVVKMTSKSYYKTHRILTPDGGLFVLEMEDAESTTGRGVTETGSLATPINSAPTDNVSQENGNVNGEPRYSVDERTAAEGEFQEPDGDYTTEEEQADASDEYLDILIKDYEANEAQKQKAQERAKMNAEDTAAQLVGKLLNIDRSKINPMDIESVKEVFELEDSNISEKAAADEYAFANQMSSKGISYAKDLGRNLDAAAGKDAKFRETLRDRLERPILKAKAEYAKAVRSKLDELKLQMDELGIKAGSEESAAVQRYGEGHRQDKYGELQDYTLEDLKTEFPEKWKDIVKAERIFRTVYNDYINRINNSLEIIYPRALERAQEAVVKNEATSAFYTAQAKVQQNVLEELNRNISAKKEMFAQKKDGTNAKADLENSIKYNERRAENIKAKIDKYNDMAERAEMEKRSIQKDIDSGEVLRNKRLMPRKDYFHHFTEIENGFKGLVNLVATPADIDARLAGQSEFTQPKSRWAAFMQKRGLGAYTEDAVGGLVKYIPAAEYKVHIDPVIAEGRKNIKGIALATEDTHTANSFLIWYTDYINDLAGKTNPADRWWQKRISRKGISVVRWINSRVKGNAIVGSFRSALSQFFNLPNAAAYIKNPASWAKGSALYWQNIFGQSSAKSLISRSGFLNERYLDSAITQFDEGILKSPKKFAYWMLTFGDEQATKLIWASAYEDGVRKNVNDPIEYADDITRRSVAGRGIGEVPLTQKSQMVQLIAPFQVEVNNTWQLLKEKTNDKDLLGLLLLSVVSYLMNEALRELLGFDVSFDPINAVKEGVEDWNKDEKVFSNITNIFQRFGGEILSTIPAGAQITQYIFSDENDRNKFFGDSDPTRFGTGNIGINTVARPLIALANGDDFSNDLLSAMLNLGLPWGGKQVERLIEGLQDMNIVPRISASTEEGIKVLPQEGGASMTDSGNLRFPIDKSNPLNVAADVLMGPFSTREGKTYIENEKTPLNEKYTALFNELVKGGASGKTAYETITKLKEQSSDKGKIQVLDSSELTDEEKAIAYRKQIAADNDKEASAMDDLKTKGADAGEVYRVMSGFKKTVATDDSSTADQKRDILLASKLTDEQKRVVYETLIDNENSEIINMFIKAGASFNEFLELSDNYTGSSGKDNAEELRTLTDAGINTKAAGELINNLEDLEPLKDKTTVSDVQKMREIALMPFSEADRLTAISVTLEDSVYQKASIASQNGVELLDYVSFKEWLPKYDSNGNGSYTQAEVQAAIEAMEGLTKDQKAVLWQIQTGGKKNPYNAALGADIRAEVEGAKESATSSTTTGSRFGGAAAAQAQAAPTGTSNKKSRFG